jgi:hypothetical protein
MLLVASVGVATMSYVAACEKSPAAGNLTTAPTLEVPPMQDAGGPTTTAPDAGPAPTASISNDPVSPTGGNLMAPTAPTATPSSKPKPHPTGGNLMAPRKP